MTVLFIILITLLSTSGTLYIGPIVISWSSLYSIIFNGLSPGFIGTRLGYLNYWLTQMEKFKKKHNDFK